MDTNVHPGFNRLFFSKWLWSIRTHNRISSFKFHIFFPRTVAASHTRVGAFLCAFLCVRVRFRASVCVRKYRCLCSGVGVVWIHTYVYACEMQTAVQLYVRTRPQGSSRPSDPPGESRRERISILVMDTLKPAAEHIRAHACAHAVRRRVSPGDDRTGAALFFVENLPRKTPPPPADSIRCDEAA